MRTAAFLLLTPWALARAAKRRGVSFLAASDVVDEGEDAALSKRLFYRLDSDKRLNAISSTVANSFESLFIASGLPACLHAEATNHQLNWLTKDLRAKGKEVGTNLIANSTKLLPHLLFGPWFSLAGPTEEIIPVVDDPDSDLPLEKLVERWHEHMHVDVDPSGLVTVRSSKCIRGHCANMTKTSRNGNPIALSRAAGAETEEEQKEENKDFAGNSQRAMLNMAAELEGQYKSGYFTNLADMFGNAFTFPQIEPFGPDLVYAQRKYWTKIDKYGIYGFESSTMGDLIAGFDGLSGKVLNLARYNKRAGYDGSVFSEVLEDTLGGSRKGKAITSDTDVTIIVKEEVAMLSRTTTRCEDGKCRTEARMVPGISCGELSHAPIYESTDM